jgi:hypothetical protein
LQLGSLQLTTSLSLSAAAFLRFRDSAAAAPFPAFAGVPFAFAGLRPFALAGLRPWLLPPPDG